MKRWAQLDGFDSVFLNSQNVKQSSGQSENVQIQAPNLSAEGIFSLPVVTDYNLLIPFRTHQPIDMRCNCKREQCHQANFNIIFYNVMFDMSDYYGHL